VAPYPRGKGWASTAFYDGSNPFGAFGMPNADEKW
jgi:hypothetical protein